MGDDKAAKGSLGRSWEVGKLGAGIAGSYFGYLLQSAFLGTEAREKKLKTTNQRVGVKLRQELQELRGPLMKIGQALSMQSHALPPELIEEISNLQRQAPGMHYSLMKVQFRNALGKDPEEIFKEFDPTPFAAASLGQVHRAQTKDGQDVVVKIQYPGIRQAVENDFKSLRAISKPVQISGHFSSAAIDEIEREVLAETDYRREADNLEFYENRVEPLGFVRTPKVYRKYSTDTVLTMSLVSGRHPDAFMADSPSQALRDKAGVHMFELFYFQLLRMNVLHADPHWGNYLIDEDGSIGLVDFGCVKYLDPKSVTALSRMFLYRGRKDGEDFSRLLDQWYAACGEKLLPKTQKALSRFSELFYSKVYPSRSEDQDKLMDFGNAAFINEFLEEARKLINNKGLLAPYIFYSRAETGLYNTLHRLKARIPTARIVRKFLAPALILLALLINADVKAAEPVSDKVFAQQLQEIKTRIRADDGWNYEKARGKLNPMNALFWEFKYFNFQSPELSGNITFMAVAPSVYPKMIAIAKIYTKNEIRTYRRVFDFSCVRSSKDSAQLQVCDGGGIKVLSPDHYRLSFQSEETRWDLDVTGQPTEDAPKRFKLDGWLPWAMFWRPVFVRSLVSGTIRAGDKNYELKETPAYHDQNWGRWSPGKQPYRWLHFSGKDSAGENVDILVGDFFKNKSSPASGLIIKTPRMTSQYLSGEFDFKVLQWGKSETVRFGLKDPTESVSVRQRSSSFNDGDHPIPIQFVISSKDGRFFLTAETLVNDANGSKNPAWLRGIASCS